jgi:hypothetical protein
MVAPAPPESDQRILSLKEFLEDVPPGRPTLVKGAILEGQNPGGNFFFRLIAPILELYCVTPNTCEGRRLFHAVTEAYVEPNEASDVFLRFQ